jgi:fatty-acyl-CoA synthase
MWSRFGMGSQRAFFDNPAISLVRGISLAEEEGIGALTIAGYLREVCERYGDREAVVLNRGAHIERWSYSDLYARSVQVARALIASGVGKDSRVGILMTNRCEYLSAVFGIAMAGGVAVALSTFSTPNELSQLIAASSISLLLFEDRVLKKDFAAVLAELEPALRQAAPGEINSSQFPFLRRLVRLNGITALEPAEAAEPIAAYEPWADFLERGGSIPAGVVEARAASVSEADAGGIFFSSGTTSLPKGILHSQRAFVIQWWRWPRAMGIEGSARAWTGNGFFWSGNIAMIIGVALSTGGTVVLQPLFDADEALRLIEAERVTFMTGRPHQWARMQAAPNYADADLSSLRNIMRGEMLMEHPTVTTRWQVPMSFGTTETMTIVTVCETDPSRETAPGNMGPPLGGNLLKLVDPKTGIPVPVGERGEICIKGPTLMTGYIGKPPEACFDDEGFYRTGDGGYLNTDGSLQWEGRLTAMIKTGGANVSPEEVDDVVARYPGVKRTQTVGVPHPTLSEMVVTCIVPVDGVELDAAAVTAFLKEQLASFKVPREVLFFKEEEFALTGNEKIKVAEVRDAAIKRLRG